MTPQMDELSLRVQKGIQKAVARALAREKIEQELVNGSAPHTNGSHAPHKPTHKH